MEYVTGQVVVRDIRIECGMCGVLVERMECGVFNTLLYNRVITYLLVLVYIVHEFQNGRVHRPETLQCFAG